MSTPKHSGEYRVISRGKWDPQASPGKIQAAIDHFHTWIDRLVAEGKMKHGQRLLDVRDDRGFFSGRHLAMAQRVPARFIATRVIHAEGFAGMPPIDQVRNARSNAS